MELKELRKQEKALYFGVPNMPTSIVKSKRNIETDAARDIKGTVSVPNKAPEKTLLNLTKNNLKKVQWESNLNTISFTLTDD